MINIPKIVNDPFYRYQRSCVITDNKKLGVKICNLL